MTTKETKTGERTVKAVRVLPYEDENGEGWVVRRDYKDGTHDHVTNGEASITYSLT